MRNTKIVVRVAFVLAAFVFMAGSVKAQFAIRKFFNPPVSPFLSDWQSRTSTATVLVTNTSGAAKTCRIISYIYINNIEVANTRAKAYNLPVISVPVGVTQYNGESLVPLSAVHFDDNVDQSSRRANRIPDGLLCIKLELEEVPIGKILAVSPKDENCAIVLSYTPPTLIQPGNNTELCRVGYNGVIDRRNGSPMPLFQWTPVVPVVQGFVTYHFAIYEVLGNQEPIAAFRGGRAIFQRDVVNLTNLLWPTEYFLPEKGKTYMWSVRALDDQGRPFILTNDGWAEPFKFVVSAGDCSNTSISGYDAKYISTHVPSCMTPGQSAQVTVTMQNSGANFWKSNGEVVCYPRPGPWNNFQFTPTPPTLPVSPGLPSIFNFKITAPQEPGTYNFSTQMFLNQTGVGGFFGETSEQIPIIVAPSCTDNIAPMIRIISPSGGEVLSAGSPFKIRFAGNDNDALSDYVISYSTDGGSNFQPLTNPLLEIGNTSAALWNIPDGLETTQARIKVEAKDKNGNTVNGISQLFSISKTGGKNDNGSANGTGLNNDPNQNSGNGNGANLYDPRTSYRFIPLGAQFILNSPVEDLNYLLPQFSLHVPAGHEWILKDEKGNLSSLFVQIPDEMQFNAVHPPMEQTLAEFTGGDTKEAKSSGGGMPHVKIQFFGNNNLPQGPPIEAHFNPKEIAVDKSVPWQHHRNSEGDDPTLEFTASEPKSLSVELMFDMFEEKKSVVPIVEGLQNIISSHLPSIVSFGSLPPVKVKIDSPHVRYTMFLPDGTPCRATVTLHMRQADSLPPRHHEKAESDHSGHQNNEDGSYMALWGASPDALPANAAPLMNEPSSQGSEGILIGLLKKYESKMGAAQSNPLYEDRKMSSMGYRYRVDFEGGGTAFFKSVGGLKSETEVIEYQEGGVNESSRKIIGSRKWPNLILKQGFTENAKVHKFLAAVSVKTATNRKGITITVYDNDGAPKRKYNFFECWPVRWQGPELDASKNELAIETVEIAHEGLQMEFPSGDLLSLQSFSGQFNSGTGVISPAQKRMTFIVQTQLDGKPATILVTGILELPTDPKAARYNMKGSSRNGNIDVNAILPGGNWNSHAGNSGEDGSETGSGSDGSNDRSYAAGHFELIIDGEPVGLIKSIEGGNIKADIIEEPGKPITMEIIPTGKSMYDWMKAAFSMKHQRKSGAIQAADFKRDIRQVREFKDALLTEIGFPACDGSAKDPAYMTIKFTPEKIRNKKENGKVENPIDVKQKMFFPGNFRMTIDGLEKACAKISKVDALTIKQSTATDDIGDARDYRGEPGKIDYPNLAITVTEEDAQDFEKWAKDFVIAGNNDESKHKHGSLSYLDETRQKELLTLDFECMGIFKGTAEASENNSDKIRRRIKYILRLKKIIIR